MLDRLRRSGPHLIEAGLLGYLILLPFARALEDFPLWLPLVCMMIGLVIGILDGAIPMGGSDRVLMACLLAFAASFVTGYIFSTFPDSTTDRGSHLPIAFMIFFAARQGIRDLSSVRRLALVLLAITVLISLDISYQWVTGASVAGKPIELGRAGGQLPHPNDLGLVPILLPLILGSLLPAGRFLALTSAAAVPLALIAILFSQSRNAVLGVSAGLAAAMLLGVRRRVIFAIAAAVASVALFAVALDLGSLPERLTSLDWSREGRVGLYLTAWRMFLDAPLFGLGNFTFGIHYLSYLERISLPAGYVPELRYIPWAHNLYLEALAERGLVGLLSFLALIASLALRAGRRLRTAQSVELRAIRLALVISLVVFLAMGLFDLTFLKDWVCFLFLLIAGVIAGPVGSLVPSATPEYSG